MYYGVENNLKVTVLSINKLFNFFPISSNYHKHNKIFTFNCILLLGKLQKEVTRYSFQILSSKIEFTIYKHIAQLSFRTRQN